MLNLSCEFLSGWMGEELLCCLAAGGQPPHVHGVDHLPARRDGQGLEPPGDRGRVHIKLQLMGFI